MKDSLKAVLKKQSYYLVGDHSAVKLCGWMKKTLTEGRVCYKQQFYGIKTHRCLQMSPTANHCNQNCLYCWRYQKETATGFEKLDDPAYILDESIRGQRVLLSGYKGNDKTDMDKWNEAQEPNQVACSLTGEPTMYPKLGEFFEECHKRGMTTFLVTNGTLPEVLEKLDPLPTQLYISVDAPNKDVYKKLCRPLIPDGWERLMKTLELLPSLDTRTVIRHTLVNGYNMDDKHVKQFAKLDEVSGADMVEPKAYMFIGYSRQRMTLDNMPRHDDVRRISDVLQEELGYEFGDEKADSRVTVIAKDAKKLKIPGL